MKSNIWKYYIFNFFVQLMFFVPVLVLFYMENNLSMTEIFLLQSIFSISIVVLEIPTGAIGDYFGKKISLMSGSLVFTLGLVIYSLGYSFTVFLIGEIVCGIGISLISGSDSALIYNTLKSLNRELDYKKIAGNANSFLQGGIMLGGLCGGFIGDYSLRMTITGSAIMAFTAFLVSIFFIEPETNNTAEKENESYKDLIKSSILIVKDHKLVLWLFFYSSIISGLGHILHWFYQPYFVLVNIPIIYFGWIYTFLGIISIIASKYTHAADDLFGSQRSLFLLALLIIIPSFFLGSIISIIAVPFLILHRVYLGISKIIFQDRVLQFIPESKAATILSMNNLGNKLVYAAVGPVMGYIFDIYDTQHALLSISIMISVLFIFMLILYRLIPEHFHKKRYEEI